MAKKSAPTKPRLRKLNKKQQKEKVKEQVDSYSPLPGSFRLVRKSFETIVRSWRTLGGILLVYLVLNIIFASGINIVTGTIDGIKLDLNGSHSLGNAVNSFAGLIGNSGISYSSADSTITVFLLILESLVIIWALRHILAGKKISIKQAYYSASSSLVQFLLVLIVLTLQLLPLLFGALIFSVVSGISGSGPAPFLAGLVGLALAGWSAYMLSGTIFALYIVTLPETQPLDALRSAGRLVRFRRWAVIRKIVFLPIFVTLAVAVIIIPLIVLSPWLAAPLFYALGMVSLLFIHAYLYSLYRGLLA